MVLDHRFSDAKLVRNLLVGIACANQTKHINFARGQLVIGSVFRQCLRNLGRYSLPFNSSERNS